MKNPESLIRPLVRRAHGYVPGEQPKIKGLVKLNTNENPYPPAPAVLKAMQSAVDGRLRLYPNPTALPLREKLAQLHGCEPHHIIVGNGSDELLALAIRTFVEPLAEGLDSAALRSNGKAKLSRHTVQCFVPSYSLYPVLAKIHGAHLNTVPLGADFAIPSSAELKKQRQWDFDAALTFVTTPNAPSGRGYSTSELEALCRTHRGAIVLDEAYVDFAKENALALALKYPNVLISRTFSKAYSLCFQRVGYFIGHPALIAGMDKLRDSYNVNGLGQTGAEATLKNLAYYRANFRRIIASRELLSSQLSELGFGVFPSQTNFIFARPPQGIEAKLWLEKLREKKFLVRWFNYPGISDRIRISIGTEAECAALIKAVRAILRK